MDLSRRILPVMFLSGACSLVYQTLWMRSFRLIFGASTMASAAVVAIFMGGLGLGSYILGKKIDQAKAPLASYARFEMIVALSAAVSPGLIWVIEQLYYATGGSGALGLFPSYLLRLALSVLVLGMPTFFMGGTLVAAVRAVQEQGDPGRTVLGRLYGVNTMGAVFGCMVTTFMLVEIFGLSSSLWLACLINLLLAVYASKLDREGGAKAGGAPAVQLGEGAGTEVSMDTWPDVKTDSDAPTPAAASKINRNFVFFCAGWVGFAFFAMEMVWYRAFAPLLGGSSYSFGIVLAVALLGIGVGGWIYGRRARGPATLLAFALSCALEALFVIIPYALGDDLARVTLSLRSFGVFGFWGMVASWTLVTAIVVLVPAIVAGYQFPLLVSLLGVGKSNIGQDVGRAYLFNTLGAILGAIGSGFGLLSWLSSNGLWVALALSLIMLALACAFLAYRQGAELKSEKRPLGLVACVAGLTALLCLAQGPTAAMRHSPIGAGRFAGDTSDPQQVQAQFRRVQKNLVWEADGREVTVGILGGNGLSFLVNGKTDGNIRGDAGTQVMCPLVAAMVHGDPKQALVIGLGTGMSAGWLAQAPGMKQVDVVELEPSILKMAELSAQSNHDVLNQPNVEIHIADGREFLQTTSKHYDVIMSEPSNPYRVGIASLFSQDFYRSVQEKLSEDGVFVQWLQVYEVDAQTVRTVMATLASVFPSVEVWSTQQGDLSLVARNRKVPHNLETLERLASLEPYRSALSLVWGVSGAHGFLSGFVAGPKLAAKVAQVDAHWVDTDDAPLLEFGFSRSVGQQVRVDPEQIRQTGVALGAGKPAHQGDLKWEQALEARVVRDLFLGRGLPPLPPGTKLSEPAKARMEARKSYTQQKCKPCLEQWRAQPEDAIHPFDQLMLARCAAITKDRFFEHLIKPVQARNEVDARLLTAIETDLRGEKAGASYNLYKAFQQARDNPWFDRSLMRIGLSLVPKLMGSDLPEPGKARMYQEMTQPFSGQVSEELRQRYLLAAGERWKFKDTCVQALSPYEKGVPLDAGLLRGRLRCYKMLGHPLAAQAEADFVEAVSNRAAPFHRDLIEEGAPVGAGLDAFAKQAKDGPETASQSQSP